MKICHSVCEAGISPWSKQSHCGALEDSLLQQKSLEQVVDAYV